MSMVRGRRQCAGFTLIEAMTASIILALVLGSLLGLSSQCFRYLTDIRRTARATQVLQQKMEDLRVLSWSALGNVNPTFVDSNAAMNTLYSGTITTNAYDSYNGSTTVMRVTLTLTWRDRSKAIQTNRLTALIANGGLNRYIY